MATDALIYLKVTTLKGLDTVEVRSSSLLVPTIFPKFLRFLLVQAGNESAETRCGLFLQ